MTTILAVILLITLIYYKLKYPTIKGAWGERKVKSILENLPKDDFYHFHDLYIPLADGRTSQIDHVVVSSKGK
ncbi:nuclease-related domain-containing protein [Bacillus sp. DJP31]|uniref:nuclease-related domain-containing protein n=1 Tax=Bacillus sp. DJP31 TaxID=3409789 RepID=UPI003BB58BE2